MSMQQMKNVCIIIPYYGKWPRFLNLFIKSCAFNKWVDILFITDLTLPSAIPPNVSKVHLPFDKLQLLVSEKMKADVALHSYYKLCDFKPMYGYIFDDLLKEYSFWGFGDIDLIYGNIGKFVTNEVLDSFDIITFRNEWLSGALTLFRNNDYINTLFKKSPDWVKVVSTNKHFSFTECAGKYNSIINGTSIFDIDGEVTSMTAVVKRENFEGNLRLFEEKVIKESISNGTYIKYRDGVVEDSKGIEYLLYHYISDKPKPYFIFPEWKKIPSIFYITKTGFYSATNFKYRHVISAMRYSKIKDKLFKKWFS
jgi:hypothetical protein